MYYVPVPGSGILMGFLVEPGALHLSSRLFNVKFNTNGCSPPSPALYLLSKTTWRALPLGGVITPFPQRLNCGSDQSGLGLVVSSTHDVPQIFFHPGVTDRSSKKEKLTLV